MQKLSAAKIPNLEENPDIFGKSNARTEVRPIIVTWQHHDSVIRIKSEILHPLMNYGTEIVTYVEVGAKYIYVGYESGQITAIRYDYTSQDNKMESKLASTNLNAHSDAVLSISTCLEFGIMVSSSSDNSWVIWDTVMRPNYPTFVKTVNLDGPVYLTEISKTSGDIAAVSKTNGIEQSTNKNKGSVLSLYSINGEKIAYRKCEPPISALAFSSAPEGTSVNVVATGHGLQTGVIRLWSTWDLSPVRDIPTSQISNIIAIAFSLDNLTLYVATEDDEILIFEQPKGNNSTTSTKKYTPKICVLDSS